MKNSHEKVLVNSDVFEKMMEVAKAAKMVVPTSEDCPLKPTLEDLAECIDNKDAEDFIRRVEER